MAPNAEVMLGSKQVDAQLDSLPPIPQQPLSQCPQDLGVGKYMSGHRRCQAPGKYDSCPHCLQAWAPNHIQTPPVGGGPGMQLSCLCPSKTKLRPYLWPWASLGIAPAQGTLKAPSPIHSTNALRTEAALRQIRPRAHPPGAPVGREATGMLGHSAWHWGGWLEPC